LTSETALLWRRDLPRDAQWKVRAVGQGYADGLAGIARDYGISVEVRRAAAEPRRGAAPKAPPKRPRPTGGST
jgi:hypothetical protein